MNPTDAAGVTMAAIQGLYQQLLVKDQEIKSLKARVVELETMKLELAEIRSLVSSGGSVVDDD